MVKYEYVLYLEPHRKSLFYQTMESFLMASLAYYGLHEGAMFPPRCDMTHFITKTDDFVSPNSVAAVFEQNLKSRSPLLRPQVGAMVPVNNQTIRENLLSIPLTVKAKGLGGIVRKPYHFMVKEFRYDMMKKLGLHVTPARMLNIPLVYNHDQWITKGKRLSRQELQMLWDVAQHTIDFNDAQKCAWHCTLYQVRRTMHFDRHHYFVERPVKTWEVSREIVPQKKWVMDWP